MKGRLGHLRPRLWSSVAAVEEASPTSLSAAKKFKNFEEMLLNFGDSLVVVTFANDLCGPCRLMKKELNQVSSQLGEDVKIFAIDTERFPKLGTKYEVRKLPTVVVFKGGRVHDRIEGVARADLLLERLRQLL
jgi:thiol-disulfide isomerase/thioredoxin